MNLPVSTQSVGFAPSNVDLAIIGDGKVSLAIASLLSSSGHRVRLWAADRNVPTECEVRERNSKVGHARGKTQFVVVTDDLNAVLKGAGVIVLSVPATEYGASLSGLCPYLANGQTIVLANAPLGAALQFRKELQGLKPGMQVNILEMGSMYDSVRIEGKVALLIGPRKRVSICGLSRNETRRALSSVSTLWGGLVPASNLLERGFTEAERIVRTTIRLFRIIGGKGSDSRQTGSTISPAVVSIVSAVGAELQSVAREFGVALPSLGQILTDYVGASGKSVGEILSSICDVLVKDNAGRGAPRENGQEKLAREIIETFVLVEEFARLARQPVPVIDSVIELASAVTERDLRKEGRGLSEVGLVGVDVRDVIEMVNA